MNRRRFLTVIAAGGSTVLLPACDEVPPSAVAPWQGPARDEGDARVRVLAWALLAPNPHNMQPWLADLREPETITLSLDPTLLLPGTDPYGRQILIGCGAFIELLRMAAAQEGYRARIAPFPDGAFGQFIGARPVARIRLERDPTVKPDPLFVYVRQRRTNRSPYEERPVTAAVERQLAAAIDTPGVTTAFSTTAAQTAALTRLAIDALRVEFATPTAWADSARVVRLGAEAIARDPSGIPINGLDVWWGLKLGVFDQSQVDDANSKPIQAALARATDALATTPLWVWQSTADESRAAQLTAGRAYLRLALAATGAGVEMQPCSQSLQEFPEMRSLYDEIHRLVGVPPPQRVQMLARLGYAPPVGRAPRRPVQKLLRA
jgi:hypothetical protein